MPSTGRRTALADAAVLLCATLVGLSSAELTLRVKSGLFNPSLTVPSGERGLYWVHPPATRLDTEFPGEVRFSDYPNRRAESISFRKGAYVFNNLGMRDGEDVDLAAPRRERVVLCIGDSTTAGLLVPEEEAYPAQLEAALNARPKARRTRVLNAGVSGYNLEQYAANAERLLPLVRPDAVVVGLYMNDAVPWPRRQRLRTWLEHHSRLFAELERAFKRLTPPRLAPGELRARLSPPLDAASADAIIKYDSMRSDFGGFLEPLGFANDTARWREALGALDRIHALCRAAGIPLVVAVFPAQFQVSFGYRHPEPQKTIGEHLAARGIPSCDMTPAFRRVAETVPLYPYLTDVAHFNARGHRLTADCLAKLPALARLP